MATGAIVGARMAKMQSSRSMSHFDLDALDMMKTEESMITEEDEEEEEDVDDGSQSPAKHKASRRGAVGHRESDRGDGGHRRKGRKNVTVVTPPRATTPQSERSASTMSMRSGWNIGGWDKIARLTSRGRRPGQPPLSPSRMKAWRIINSRSFDIVMCFVVAANSVAIGIEQSYRLDGEPTAVFDALEQGFLWVYILELGLRFYAMRCECLFSNWVRFDILVILVGVITNWVLVPIYGEVDQIGSLLVVRMVRLMRLARILKMVARCKELLMLVHGLVNSVSTMFYTVVLLGLILYVLGSMSLEVVTIGMRNQEFDNPDVPDIIDQNFRTLPLAMLSLVQFITFDNVVYIYKPLVDADPLLAIFFMSVLLVVGVVFMNLVTAVIVNSSLEQALQDKDIQKAATESKRKKLVQNLRDAFYRADTDESGEITREELEQISADDKESLRQMLGIDDLIDIFDNLDVDGDGEIGIEEFCSGIERIVTSETSIEFKRMERLMHSMHKQLKDVTRRQDDLRESVTRMMQTAMGEEPPSVTASEGDGAPDTPEKTAVRPMPPWANHMILEMKEACNADLRRFMGEAFASLAHLQPQLPVQASEDVASQQSSPRAFDAASACSNNTLWADEPKIPATHCSLAAALLEKQKLGVWEALPPTEQPKSPELLPSAPADEPPSRPKAQRAVSKKRGGKTAGSKRGGQRPEKEVEPSRPLEAADDQQRQDGGGAQAPSQPAASPRPPRIGGFVPASTKPTLLAGASEDTEAPFQTVIHHSLVLREEL